MTHGILPIENSVGGSIHRNYDLLLEHELPIVGETELTVVHNLLALPGTPIEAIRRVFSHPQALAQTERFVRTLPGVEVVATYDTAGSARLDSRRQPARHRGDRLGPRRRGLRPRGPARRHPGLRRQHHPLHPGRRAIRQPLGRADKTTLAFTLHNAPGALFKALSVFALRDIDLTKLESRPARGLPWEYLFYVDVGVGRDDVRCTRAIGHLTESAQWVRTLGSYPRWTGEPQPVEAIPCREERASPGTHGGRLCHARTDDSHAGPRCRRHTRDACGPCAVSARQARSRPHTFGAMTKLDASHVTRTLTIELPESDWAALRSVEPDAIGWLQGRIRERLRGVGRRRTRPSFRQCLALVRRHRTGAPTRYRLPPLRPVC